MKISVVIPAYNEEKYIGKTLESVRNLEIGTNELEILVIDGDSKDKTPKIAKSFGARVKHEPHKGIGFARQHGIMHASGDIIAFTDADTIVPQNWLLMHLENLNKPNVSFSFGLYKVKDGRFPYYHFINYIQPNWIWFLHSFFGFPVAAGQNQAFWREKALKIGGFDTNLLLFEDIDFAVRMKKVGKVILSTNNVVISSGRRSNEGWGFFGRMIVVILKYFFVGKRNLGGFTDYR